MSAAHKAAPTAKVLAMDTKKKLDRRTRVRECEDDTGEGNHLEGSRNQTETVTGVSCRYSIGMRINPKRTQCRDQSAS